MKWPSANDSSRLAVWLWFLRHTRDSQGIHHDEAEPEENEIGPSLRSELALAFSG
jgi:hypothetical protein